MTLPRLRWSHVSHGDELRKAKAKAKVKDKVSSDQVKAKAKVVEKARKVISFARMELVLRRESVPSRRSKQGRIVRHVVRKDTGLVILNAAQARIR